MNLKHENSHTEELDEIKRQAGSEEAVTEQSESYLTAEEVDVLLAEREQLTQRTLLDVKKWGWWVLVLLVVPLIGINLLRFNSPTDAFWILSLTMLTVSISSILFCVNIKRHNQHLWQILEKLTQSNDLRGIGTLIECLRYVKGAQRHNLIEALTRLLPHLQSGDATLFNLAHQSNLCTMLNGEESTQPISFQIAVLKAFEKVGNTSALPYVQHLAERVPKTGKGRELQKAAQSCLVVLRERARHEQNEQTLLRPSGSDQTSDVLLRPAMANQETKPDELLRPSAGKEND